MNTTMPFQGVHYQVALLPGGCEVSQDDGLLDEHCNNQRNLNLTINIGRNKQLEQTMLVCTFSKDDLADVTYKC